MHKFVAINWDSHELRYAMSEGTGYGLCSVSCKTSGWDDAEAREHVAGSLDAVVFLLKKTPAFGAHGLIVARPEDFEWSRLAVPPIDDHELPALIENHLTITSSFGGDDPVYDYTVLDGNQDSPRLISIVAMSKSRVDDYLQMAKQLKLKKPRLVLRASGSAALLPRLGSDPEKATMLVIPIREEIDIVVTAEGMPFFGRTIFSSQTSDSESYRKGVLAEVIRTLAVSGDQLPENREVQRVAVMTDQFSRSGYRALEHNIDLPLIEVDVSAGLKEVDIDIEEMTTGFIPLIGLLANESEGQVPDIDLFHPAQPKTTSIKRRSSVTALVGAAIMLLLGCYWVWDRVAQAESNAEQLSAELKSLQNAVEQLADDGKTLQEIEQWRENSIIWLDELQDLSARFPPAGTITVTSITASPNRMGGAIIRLNGKAQDPSVVTALDQTLSDKFRKVLSRNFREESGAAEAAFAWRFESVIQTQRKSAKQYQQPVPPVVWQESISTTP
jgi:Tfp pilus assembly protein PilN